MHVGIAGTGRWGREIVRVLDELGVHFSTFDTYLSSTYNTYAELLQNVDAVCIAAPPQEHYRMVQRALAYEIPVFVEKPLAMTHEQALHLQTMARTLNVPVAVGHIVLTADGYQKHRTAAPNMIYAARHGMNPGYHAVPAWWDLAVHDVAVCVDLLGRPVIVDVDGDFDSYSARLIWNQAEAYLMGNRNAPEKRWELTFDGAFYSPYEEGREPLRTELAWWLEGGDNLDDAVTVVETLERGS